MDITLNVRILWIISGLSSGVLRIEILSHSNEFDSLVSAIVKEIQVKTIEEW